jgi:hypothetical protein
MRSVGGSQKRRFEEQFPFQYVLVAGGGAGSVHLAPGYTDVSGGAGGAGGVSFGEIYATVSGTAPNRTTRAFPVVIGSGGAAVPNLIGHVGQNSIFDLVIAFGGGYGGGMAYDPSRGRISIYPGYYFDLGYSSVPAGNGGSGGGSCEGGGTLVGDVGAGYSTQGRRGGGVYCSGGGGGYSSEGFNDEYFKGNGGNGGRGVNLADLMSGLTGYVAGGGGGAAASRNNIAAPTYIPGVGGIGGGGNGDSRTSKGSAGTPNTGGGGGGGCVYLGIGNPGGSGVLYLKYPSFFSYTATGLTLTDLGVFGSSKILKVTASTEGANISFHY